MARDFRKGRYWQSDFAESKMASSKAGKAAENKVHDNAKDLVKDVAPDLPVSIKAGDYVRFGSYPQKTAAPGNQLNGWFWRSGQ